MARSPLPERSALHSPWENYALLFIRHRTLASFSKNCFKENGVTKTQTPILKAKTAQFDSDPSLQFFFTRAHSTLPKKTKTPPAINDLGAYWSSNISGCSANMTSYIGLKLKEPPAGWPTCFWVSDAISGLMCTGVPAASANSCA